MAKIHSLGFPRIGKKRELKHALESYWHGEINEQSLSEQVDQIQQQRYEALTDLDFFQVGDFSLYDHVLDTSFLFGNVPSRAITADDKKAVSGANLDQYFRVARGRAKHDDCCTTYAGEMTKWFNTNYHYIVPEFTADTRFALQPKNLLDQIRQARAQGLEVKPVIIGPISYLYLGKSLDKSNRLELLDDLLKEYKKLLQTLCKQGVQWVQLDEPALVLELTGEWQFAYKYAYEYLQNSGVNSLLATYFGDLADNLNLVSKLPVDGIHIDAINAPHEVALLDDKLGSNQILSVGILDGRNVWRTDLSKAISLLKPLADSRGDKLWIAPSCSLLHCPVDLDVENTLPEKVKPWLAFASQKIEELVILKRALSAKPEAVNDLIKQNQAIINARLHSELTKNSDVRLAQANIQEYEYSRTENYATRIQAQQAALKLPLFPTTTIGSFPQTSEIRGIRKQFLTGEISQVDYDESIKKQIATCIKHQQEIGLDVFVHGEAERNDMVEYFATFLDGMLTTQFGWVQSYGSRCVKPPIIYGDISRSKSITVDWIGYAQSLTDKPVKGMLTGPVTILNWSFVRNDLARSLTAQQLALAIKNEVLDLEARGTQIIQIDEAALREGLPLKQSQWQEYLDWAVDAFKLCSSAVRKTTQIHTHMCYSQFNDILPDIQRMDADVITIETSRANMKLLDAFNDFSYQNDIGPGVYDIHSPNIPSINDIKTLVNKAAEKVPASRLWVNPDCGLKTRKWEDVIPALSNLVTATKQLREVHETSLQ